MRDKAIKDDPSSLFIPDWFVTQQQLDAWLDDDYWYHDDDITEWYKSLYKTKGSESKDSRKIIAYCLASIRMARLVCS